MSDLRPSTPQKRLALKAAFRLGLGRAGGGASFTHATRVKEAALSKYAAAHDSDYFVPLDVALDLDLDLGAPVVLSALAKTQGYDIVPVGGCNDMPKISDLSALAQKVCTVQCALALSFEGGVISKSGAEKTLLAIDEALDNLRTLRGRLEYIGAADAE